MLFRSLSDDINNPIKWKFPDIAFIPANGFLLVWADDMDTTFLDHHTNFNLANTGDSIFLVNAALTYFDSTSFSAMSTDTSFARCPDGTGAFQLSIFPSPRAPNNCAVSVDDILLSHYGISLFPNPASEQFMYVIDENVGIEKITILNVTGQVVKSLAPVQRNTVNISELTPGLYFVVVAGRSGVKRTLKLVKQ